jgi:putative tricarboxylic transport membrane protein
VRANDVISGLVVIVVASAMIALTASIPDFPGQKYGPALFPRVLGAGLILAGALLVWNGLAARRAGAPWVEVAPWAYEPWRVASFLLMIAMLVVYIVAAETVGFILTASIFLLSLFLFLGVRWLPAVATTVVVVLAIQYFFASMLRVPLPRGWLTDLM